MPHSFFLPLLPVKLDGQELLVRIIHLFRIKTNYMYPSLHTRWWIILCHDETCISWCIANKDEAPHAHSREGVEWTEFYGAQILTGNPFTHPGVEICISWCTEYIPYAVFAEKINAGHPSPLTENIPPISKIDFHHTPVYENIIASVNVNPYSCWWKCMWNYAAWRRPGVACG